LLLLGTLAATLSVAAAVYLSWWLGVWGWLRVLTRRVELLEDDNEYLRVRNRKENGREARAKGVALKSKEDKELELLEQMAARERKGPVAVPDADFEDADTKAGA